MKPSNITLEEVKQILMNSAGHQAKKSKTLLTLWNW